MKRNQEVMHCERDHPVHGLDEDNNAKQITNSKIKR